MKMSAVMKSAVQTVAVAVGLFGVMEICFGICCAVMCCRDLDRTMAISMALMCPGLGAIFILAARQTLWHFGPAAIRDLVGLFVFFGYCGMSRFFTLFGHGAKSPVWH